MPWFYQHGEGEIVGPIDLDSLRQLVQQGQVNGNTQVSFAESGQSPETWQLAHSVKDLQIPRRVAPSISAQPPFPAPRRLDANSPLRQASQSRRQSTALPGLNLLTLFIVILGTFFFAVGVISVLLDGREALQGPNFSVWVWKFAPFLLISGPILIVISLLYEILRTSRATLRFLERQHLTGNQLASTAARGEGQNSPDVKKHPLD